MNLPCGLSLLMSALLAAPGDPVASQELTGRLLDEDGSAVASTELTYAVAVEYDGRLWNQGVLLATDAEGRFRIELLPWEESGVLVVRDSPKERGFRRELAGLGGGVQDLGDVTLERAPVLATGQVLDENGNPAARCPVQAEEPMSHRIGEEPSWARIGDVQTDARGHFEVRGWTASPRVRIQARRGRRVSEGHVVAPGAADLALSLAGVGRLQGHVPAPFPLLHGAVQVAACREGGQRISAVPVQDTGEFLFTNLPAGTYDLEFEGRVLGERLRRIERVTVKAGQASEDPRLQEVDLTRSIRSFTVSVTDEAGDPLQHFLVFARRGPAADYRSAWHSDRFQVVSLQPGPVELVLSRPGHRNLRVDGVGRDLTLVLPTGIPVLVVLDEGLPALAAGFLLRAQVSTRSPVPLHGDRSADLDADGQALLYASEPGPAEIGVYLVRNESPVFYEDGIAVVVGHLLQLEDSTEVQEVHLRVDPERLRRLMDEAMKEDD